MKYPKPHFAPKTAFAKTEPKPKLKPKKPDDQQCLGTLEFDKGPCQVRLPYNPAKRLCANCTSRNSKQSRSVASQGGGGVTWKMSGSHLNAS
jgi:hypothetical protein